MCDTYNLSVFPEEYLEPKIYKFGESDMDAAIRTWGCFHDTLGPLQLVKLLYGKDYFEDFRESLEKVQGNIAFQEMNSTIYRKHLAVDFNLAVEQLEKNKDQILTYIFDVLYNIYRSTYTPIKPKHIKRALFIKRKRMPTRFEIMKTFTEVSDCGYKVAF